MNMTQHIGFSPLLHFKTWRYMVCFKTFLCISFASSVFAAAPSAPGPVDPPLIVAPAKLPPSAVPPQPTGLANLKILADKMECFQEDEICVASGNASAVKLDSEDRQTVNADKLIAHFEKEKEKEKKEEDGKEKGSGSTKISLIEAEGNVFMVKGPTIIQGDKGTYDTKTEIAHVYGDVRITSDENQINGDHGEVNMKTGHYKIDNKEKQQVQALLYTKDKDKKDKKDKSKSLKSGLFN